MIKTIYAIWSICLLCYSLDANAGSQTYSCVIQNIYDLKDSGELSLNTTEWKKVRGSAFSISRDTGSVVGEHFSTDVAVSVKVLDRGSARESFRAIADFGSSGATHAFQLFEVREWTKGPRKPFVAYVAGGIGVITGTCT